MNLKFYPELNYCYIVTLLLNFLVSRYDIIDRELEYVWAETSVAVFFVFIAGVNPCVLCFRVKFYPSDPMKLHEEITRYAAGKVTAK